MENKNDNFDNDIPVDFTTFILSLSSSAYYHLGKSLHPETDSVQVNLPMARQTIDILHMLHEKTHGNITAEEDRLLHEILDNLTEEYDAQKSAKKSTQKSQ